MVSRKILPLVTGDDQCPGSQSLEMWCQCQRKCATPSDITAITAHVNAHAENKRLHHINLWSIYLITSYIIFHNFIHPTSVISEPMENSLARQDTICPVASDWIWSFRTSFDAKSSAHFFFALWASNPETREGSNITFSPQQRNRQPCHVSRFPFLKCIQGTIVTWSLAGVVFQILRQCHGSMVTKVLCSATTTLNPFDGAEIISKRVLLLVATDRHNSPWWSLMLPKQSYKH